MSSRVDDELFDVLVKHAGFKVLAESGEDSTEAYAQTPLTLDSRIRARIGRKAAGRRAKTALKVLVRVAAVLAVIMAVSATAIFSSEAMRIKVLDLLYHDNGGSVGIRLSENEDEPMPNDVAVAKWVPCGFELIETKEDPCGTVTTLYQNDAGDAIRVRQLPQDAPVRAAGGNAREFDLGGHKALLSETDGSSTVAFSDGCNRFILSGNAPAEDLIAMARSMIE